jgi:hypothetical protein
MALVAAIPLTSQINQFIKLVHELRTGHLSHLEYPAPFLYGKDKSPLV